MNLVAINNSIYNNHLQETNQRKVLRDSIFERGEMTRL